MNRFRPVSPGLLADELVASFVARHPGSHPLRVGLDAPGWVELDPLLTLLDERLRAVGRAVAIVSTRLFYRDASLRWEYGKDDLDSFYDGWLDTGALQREVLRPLAIDGNYLPSLRDPDSNRSTRATPLPLPSNGVALLVGELLFGHGLELDVAVHFSVNRQARRRQAPDDLQWTLPAYDRYELEVDPAGLADMVVRYDDPAHPALLVR